MITPSENRWITVFANLVVAAILVKGGLAVRDRLIASHEPPNRQQPAYAGELVSVETIAFGTQHAPFVAQGTVVTAREWTLSAEVGGRIETLSPTLVTGGFVQAGETLIEIDRGVYRATLAQRRAELEQAQAALEVERGLGELATDEWNRFSAHFDGDENPDLAQRRPQLASAEAAVEAAESRVQLARMDVGRARVTAPFDAYVQSESVELDQYVAPGQTLGQLISTDALWVEVAVPVARLADIAIPGVNADRGAEVTLTLSEGDDHAWTGHVLRLLGDLTPAGRQARLLVEVPDPWGRQSGAAANGLPLFIGAYVDVSLPGPPGLEGVLVDRSHLRNGNTVWLYHDGTLDIREVEIGARMEDTVIVTSGLSTGDELVTSRIGLPLQGMALRRDTDPAPTPAEGAPGQGQGSGQGRGGRHE